MLSSSFQVHSSTPPQDLPVQNGQSEGDSPPAVEHAIHHRTVGVILAEGIAMEPELPKEKPVHRVDDVVQARGGVDQVGQLLRDVFDLLLGVLHPELRVFLLGDEQRAAQDVDLLIVAPNQLGKLLAGVTREHGSLPRSGDRRSVSADPFPSDDSPPAAS